MTTTFTGPDACVECATELNPVIALTIGIHPATVEVRGHHLEVPGLYRCVSCHQAVKDGQESKVTLDTAFAWLEDDFGPNMAAGLLGPDAGPELAAIVLHTIEIATVLEAVIALRDAGELDEIPECSEATCGHKHGQDKDLAHLN